MSLLGNILWILLGGGIFIFFEYLLGALFLCLTIVGIPFGLQCLKLALLGLLPFGKQVIQTPPGSGCLSTLMNVIWILTFGWFISLTHLVFALLTA
ncbi:MAG: YccF domain-containing protein, partial [bacterium]